MNRILFFVIINLFIVSNANGHESDKIKQTHMTAKAAIVARSGDVLDTSYYDLPGFFVGGDSIASDTGFALEDVQLLATKNVNDQYFVSAKLGGHQHQDEVDLELENFWLGGQFLQNLLQVEVGRMASEVTPTANYHAAQDAFTEAPLLADVFFGRHHKDVGVRATIRQSGFELGVELWDGQGWPSGGRGSDLTSALYTSWQLETRSHRIGFRAWGYNASVTERSDERFDSGHQHAISDDVTAVSFTGDVQMFGGIVAYSYLGHQLVADTELEWINAKHDGEAFTDGHIGQVRNDTQGIRLKQSFTLAQHQVNLQYEILSVDNVFIDTSELLARSLGLYNEGVEPSRWLINWRWQATEDIALVTEYLSERLVSKDRQNRLSAGIIWRWDFL